VSRRRPDSLGVLALPLLFQLDLMGDLGSGREHGRSSAARLAANVGIIRSPVRASILPDQTGPANSLFNSACA
jgi:hypothetical protein